MASQTALFDLHKKLGARIVDFAGWDMPVQYKGIVEEHNAVRNSQGAFDISHMGRIHLDGAGAGPFLAKLATCDVLTLAPGQIRYGLVLNDDAFALDDVLVYRLEKSWYLVVNASNRGKILDWIQTKFPNPDFRLHDETSTTAMIAIQGPKAVATCSKIAGTDFSGMGYYRCQELSWQGARLLASRTGYTGEDGMEWTVPAAKAQQLADELEKAGVPWSGLGARDTLRLEAAMPLYGHELDESTDPLQAGLGFAIRKSDTDFFGGKALAGRTHIANRPVRIGLKLAGKRIARQGDKVLKDGQQVGTVTSGTFGPTVGASIAMAMVDPSVKSPGLALTVDVRGKPEEAQVVKLPFYKRPVA